MQGDTDNRGTERRCDCDRTQKLEVTVTPGVFLLQFHDPLISDETRLSPNTIVLTQLHLSTCANVKWALERAINVHQIKF